MKIIKHQEIWKDSLVNDWQINDFYTGGGIDDDFETLVKTIEGRDKFRQGVKDKEDKLRQEQDQEKEQIKKQILDEAKVQADEILSQAKIQSDVVKGQAFNQGLTEAAQEAEKRAKEKFQALYEQEVLKLQALASQISLGYPQAIKKAQEGLVKLALEIAKKVIKDEGVNRQEVVMRMVEEGLSRTQDKAYVKLRVNPMQLPMVHEKKEEFLARFHEIKNFEIVADQEVFPGGCIVDTDSGSIDLRLDKQFSVVKEHISAEGEADESF